MIYLAGREVREIYLGNRPVASIYLGGQLIWQSRVCMEAGAVIVLTSDAALRTADGITYTVEVVGGAVSCVKAETVSGADANNGTVFAVPVVAEPYIRHIAPTQTASLQTPLAGTIPALAVSEFGRTDAIGEPVQIVNIMLGSGNDTAAQHIGTGIQQSAPVLGHGDILRHGGVFGGVHGAGVTPGTGNAMDQSHTGAWIQKAALLNADGIMQLAVSVAGGEYDVDSANSDGQLYAVRSAVGAVHDIKPMYADTDDIAACDYQTPTAAAELLGSYAGVRQIKTADGATSACATAAPVSASGAPAAVFPTGGAICAACMITRLYTDPPATVFDTALVTEMDILALAEIDQMAIQN